MEGKAKDTPGRKGAWQGYLIDISKGGQGKPSGPI